MPKVSFTKENLLETNQLEAGWRILDVKSISNWKKGVNDPTSLTIEALFVVAEGNGAGTPVKHWFSEKQMGRLSNYVKCFVAKLEPGKELDLGETVGRKVQGYCEYDIKSGFNTIKDFRPINK